MNRIMPCGNIKARSLLVWLFVTSASDDDDDNDIDTDKTVFFFKSYGKDQNKNRKIKSAFENMHFKSCKTKVTYLLNYHLIKTGSVCLTMESK